MNAPAVAADHGRWLYLAASEPTFQLRTDDAQALAGHLAGCAACARQASGYRADLTALAAFDAGPLPERVRTRIATRAAGPTASLRPVLLLGVLTLLVAGVLGTSLGVGAWLGRPVSPIDGADAPPGAGWPLAFEAGSVTLSVGSVAIEAAGRRSVYPAGDDGAADRGWPLDLTWTDAGVEHWVHLGLIADGEQWWIHEIDTFDGQPGARPAIAAFPSGRYAATRIGESWSGDLTVVGTGRAGDVKLVLEELSIVTDGTPPFAAPPGGGVDLNDRPDPLDPGGAIRCSGILQLNPAEAERRLRALDYRLSWRWSIGTGPNTGFTWLLLEAPDTGYISDAGVGEAGELVVFVEDPARPFSRSRFERPADCPGAAP